MSELFKWRTILNEIVYNEATKEKYNFLFCMVDEEKFLHNFMRELANGKDHENNKKY